jgi:hypothetical protein
VRFAICLLISWTVFTAGAAIAKAPAPKPGRIAGSIPGRAGAVVIVCDAKTGIPVHAETWRPFSQEFRKRSDKELVGIAHVVTDQDGRFRFENVPAGTYHLMAQSWTEPFKGPFEVNGEVIELHGVARSISVPSEAAEKVVIKPLGTGVVQIDQKSGNSSGILMLSTAEPLGDPVLGFTGLGDKYFGNLIGGNRMPKGRTKIIGLPPGPVHAAVFMPDNVPGFGFGTLDPSAAGVQSFPMVAAWSDGQHDPPERIAGIIAGLKRAAGKERVPDDFLYQVVGVDAARVKRMKETSKKGNALEEYTAKMALLGPLDRSVELAGVGKVRVIDLLAAFSYMELQRHVETIGHTKQKPGATKAVPRP